MAKIAFSFFLIFCFSYCKRQSELPAQNNNAEKILFTADVNSSPLNWQLFTINPDGTGETQLMNFTYPASSGGMSEASWSPDRKKIVCVSPNPARGNDIYIMNVDGTNVSQLTNSDRFEQHPYISPDGKKILFEARVVSTGMSYISQLFTMNIDGTGETQLTNFSNGTNFLSISGSWSPDGTKIVFHSDKDNPNRLGIYVMNADGSAITRLTTGTSNIEYNPSFSPNGTKILFTARVFDPVSTQHKMPQIFTINSDGTGTTQLTNFTNSSNMYNIVDLSWSPDGSKIAFISSKDDPYGPAEMYTMNADGTNMKRLTTNRREERSLNWK
jgi:Tol biopolymer transport system component